MLVGVGVNVEVAAKVGSAVGVRAMLGGCEVAVAAGATIGALVGIVVRAATITDGVGVDDWPIVHAMKPVTPISNINTIRANGTNKTVLCDVCVVDGIAIDAICGTGIVGAMYVARSARRISAIL